MILDLRHLTPLLFTDPGTLLYVGARLDACTWLTELAVAGNMVTLIDVWMPNLAAFQLKQDPRICDYRRLDIRQLTAIPRRRWDYVFWWNGPEHVEKSLFPDVLKKLETRATQLTVLASPWGIQPQGALAGNPYEARLWSVYPDDFIKHGYAVATEGQEDHPGGEIVAWKETWTHP